MRLKQAITKFFSQHPRNKRRFQDITKMARQYFNVELKGNPIIFSNGARYISYPPIKARHKAIMVMCTAMSSHGLRNFKVLYGGFCHMRPIKNGVKLISLHPLLNCMKAMHFGQGICGKSRIKNAVILFSSLEQMCNGGVVCPDGAWRYVITIHDALKRGAGVLFDLESIKTKIFSLGI